jgi:hypothetical protein
MPHLHQVAVRAFDLNSARPRAQRQNVECFIRQQRLLQCPSMAARCSTVIASAPLRQQALATNTLPAQAWGLQKIAHVQATRERTQILFRL